MTLEDFAQANQLEPTDPSTSELLASVKTHYESDLNYLQRAIDAAPVRRRRTLIGDSAVPCVSSIPVTSMHADCVVEELPKRFRRRETSSTSAGSTKSPERQVLDLLALPRFQSETLLIHDLIPPGTPAHIKLKVMNAVRARLAHHLNCRLNDMPQPKPHGSLIAELAADVSFLATRLREIREGGVCVRVLHEGRLAARIAEWCSKLSNPNEPPTSS